MTREGTIVDATLIAALTTTCSAIRRLATVAWREEHRPAVPPVPLRQSGAGRQAF